MANRDVPSRMLVATQETTDATVSHGSSARHLLARELDRRLWHLQRSPTRTWRSPARFSSLSPDVINRSAADVVNLHWVTDGFLSIEAIGRIDRPLVWSMYDMWPFCGTEHYGIDTPSARWRTGYAADNRPKSETGFDLDRWAYNRKRAHWLGRPPAHLVPASTWLADATRASALLGDWPVHRIPHVVDTTTFAPCDRGAAREALGLPADAPTILFLASAGVTDDRKGWDLLEAALPVVHQVHPDVTVVAVGPVPDGEVQHAVKRATGTSIYWHGSVDTSSELRLLYSASDVTAVPSREDTMPLTAMEAQACGRSVVAFRIGGLPDIVTDETGVLCPPFNVDALAAGLLEALDDARGDNTRGRQARERALDHWSPQAVVPQYVALYEQVLA
jgi:glycosyltransferase involved in cell wall biosynthesis